MKRSSILVAAALSLFSVITVQACSGDEGDDDNDTMTPGLNPGTGGTGGAAPGTGTGGTAPVATNGGTGNVVEGQGGAPVTTNGGTTGTSPANNGGSPAGMGGSPAGMGGAPTGMGGAPVTGAPPACIEPPAPSNGTACTVTCTDPCSVHALGSRVCTCTASAYACATCIFANPNNPLITPPTAPLTPCPADDSAMEDATGCVEPERCESIRRNADMELSRFCACQAGQWDCDSKPSSFP